MLKISHRDKKAVGYPGTRWSSVNAPYLFIAPSFVLLAVFFVIPVVAAFLMSFTDFDIYSLAHFRFARFVGLGNYMNLFSDPLFWKSMFNTFYFLILGGPLTIFVALLAAVLLNSKLVKFRSLLRLGFFAPVVATLVAVSVVWKYIYDPRFGLLNYALSFLGVAPRDWLSDPVWAMPAIILFAVWKNFGYTMMIFLAGLQTIPEVLYDAAGIDGAGSWQRFWRITVPMLAPTTLFVTVVTLIGYLQLFAEPYIMTGGGPMNSTLSIVLLMYRQGFRYWQMGYAASLAFVLAIVIFILTMIEMRVQKEGSAV
ncbi:MAG: sugar ABC transporter permease [Bacteroidetes bacterium]|nr:sugar ABC transporter permease [Bacteroidota bacterium]